MWTLQRIPLRRDIPRFQQQQFTYVLLNSRSLKFRKTHRNALAPESLFKLQPSPFLKKRRRHIHASVSFADLYYGKHPVNWENFKGKLYEKWQTDILIIKKRYREVNTLFEKIDIAMKSVYLRTIDRKLILNLIVIFTFSSQIFLF